MDDDDDDEEDKLIRFTFLSYSFVDSRFFSNKKKTKKKKKFDMIFSGQYRRNCHCFNAAKTDKEEEEEKKTISRRKRGSFVVCWFSSLCTGLCIGMSPIACQ